jgi:hypothetical protein
MCEGRRDLKAVRFVFVTNASLSKGSEERVPAVSFLDGGTVRTSTKKIINTQQSILTIV